MNMKEEILTVLTEANPTVDWNAEFLFDQLDSMGVISLLMALSVHFGISLRMTDATPKNLMSLDSIVKMVETKLQEK